MSTDLLKGLRLLLVKFVEEKRLPTPSDLRPATSNRMAGRHLPLIVEVTAVERRHSLELAMRSQPKRSAISTEPNWIHR